MSRHIMLLGVLLLVMAGLSVGHVPLREFDGKIVRWDLEAAGQPNVVNGRVTWFMDPAGTIDVPTGLDEELSVKAAFDNWENVETSKIAFLEDDSRVTYERDTQDRINLIQWRERYLPPGTLALTFPYSQSGVMTDVDIILNDDMTWDTSEVGQDFVADVEAVLTHEIGHMIGLDHSPIGGSTMYPELPLGSIRSRTLESDDITGITALYPDRPKADERGNLRGKALIDGKGDSRGVLIVAMNVITRLPESCAVTTEGGQYLMERLPPGLYRVFAFPLSGKEGMVPYWLDTNTDFMGQSYGAVDASPARAQMVDVRFGMTTFGIDFPDLKPDFEALEPNDRPIDATPMNVQDSAIGTAASVADEDWYRFVGTAGDRIAIHVDAFHVGGDTNVQVDLYEAGMVTEDGVDMSGGSEPPHPRSVDIRPHIVDENRTSLEGVDTDAMLGDVVLKKDGYHFIRVTFSPASNTGKPSNYYLLTIYRDNEAPDEVASEYSSWPPSVPADGAWTSEIRIVPRNLGGEALGPGVALDVTGEGKGTIGTPVDNGDGSYSVMVTAPTNPGTEEFAVRMQTDAGSATAMGAVAIRYLGPPDPGQSDFRALPGRIDSDGVARSTLSLKVRDADGSIYGPGLPVTFEFKDDPDGQLGGVDGDEDGEYTCTVTAAGSDAVDEFEAAFDGEALGVTTRVHYGFLLSQVVEDSLAVMGNLSGDGGLPKSARRHLDRAIERMHEAKALLATGDAAEEVPAVIRLSKAVKCFEKALKKAGLTPGEVEFELSEAGGRYTKKVLEAARLPSGASSYKKLLSRAWRTHDRGARHHVKGAWSKALKRYGRALKTSIPLR